MKYSKNGGTKGTINNTTTNITVNASDKVQFYGNGTSTKDYLYVSITGSATTNTSTAWPSRGKTKMVVPR